MDKRNWFGCVALLLAVAFLVVARLSPLAAQDPPADKGSTAVLRISLDEIKQRILADSKLLHLAALNVQSKGYAVRVSQANYLPVAPIRCADEAVSLALANSPEIREAEQNIAKARAAVAAAKLDYVPSIAVVGGYSNQTAADYIEPNIGFVGVMGTYTFVDWGKRRNTIHERDQLVAMATLKVGQTQDDVRATLPTGAATQLRAMCIFTRAITGKQGG